MCVSDCILDALRSAAKCLSIHSPLGWISEVEVRETFAMLDTDGSGYITIASLLRFMNKHFENEGGKMQALLNDGDLDGDDKISSDEFVAAIMPNLPQPQGANPRRKSFIRDLPADHPELQAKTPTNANAKVRLVDTLVK